MTEPASFDDEFRTQVRDWLAAHLVGEFAELGARGGPGREHEGFEVRLAWEKLLGRHGWTCLGWPAEYGGRGASLAQQVIFHEEYARAGAPARVGYIGENLLGPTVLEFGTEEHKRRFLPPIVRGEELWCQGYSEPGAGSDLAAVATRADLVGDSWVLTGQKVWTSLAHVADWCFVLARSEAGSRRHAGLSYLLVPMRQPGIEVRPIRQLTGTSEFNEVFFDGARTDAANILGAPGEGWRVAMFTLGVERGVATLGQQVGFERELAAVVAAARHRGTDRDPQLRDRLAEAWVGLQVLRAHALATLGAGGTDASVSKLLWSNWHQALGELAVDVLGADALLTDGFPYELTDAQRLFLFSRADTIYGGSNEIQRTILAERLLGLPRDDLRR
ncbi:MAG: acyl-CoA dehydrogenase family protein [Mycobacteriales bacterium]